VSIVVDASVALKWVIEEDGSRAARELLLGELLAAPNLVIVECANVLWVKARRGQINRELASCRAAGHPGRADRLAAGGKLYRRGAGDRFRSRPDRL
jgi:hypothetical protein